MYLKVGCKIFYSMSLLFLSVFLKPAIATPPPQFSAATLAVYLEADVQQSLKEIFILRKMVHDFMNISGGVISSLAIIQERFLDEPKITNREAIKSAIERAFEQKKLFNKAILLWREGAMNMEEKEKNSTVTLGNEAKRLRLEIDSFSKQISIVENLLRENSRNFQHEHFTKFLNNTESSNEELQWINSQKPVVIENQKIKEWVKKVLGNYLEVAYSGEDFEMSFDAAALYKVINNLERNAEDAKAEKINVIISTENGWVKMEFQDDGNGMDEEALNAVNEILSGERKKAFSTNEDPAKLNRGIGTQIIRDEVKKLGGRIKAFSAGLNQGSTFTLLIPTTLSPETQDLLAREQNEILLLKAG